MLVTVTLSISATDITEKLEACGLVATKENVYAVESAIRDIANAWALAALQDADKETLLSWIESENELSEEATQ